MGVIFNIFSTGLRANSLAEDYTRAVAIAESKLASIGVSDPITLGTKQGNHDEGMRWEERVKLYGENPELYDSKAYSLYEVTVEVFWDEGNEKPRSVSLTSIRIAPSPPQ